MFEKLTLLAYATTLSFSVLTAIIGTWFIIKTFKELTQEYMEVKGHASKKKHIQTRTGETERESVISGSYEVD